MLWALHQYDMMWSISQEKSGEKIDSQWFVVLCWFCHARSVSGKEKDVVGCDPVLGHESGENGANATRYIGDPLDVLGTSVGHRAYGMTIRIVKMTIAKKYLSKLQDG